MLFGSSSTLRYSCCYCSVHLSYPVALHFLSFPMQFVLLSLVLRLPILNQPDYIRQALSANKHVLSEKPVAENLRDAQELIKWYHSNIDSKKIFWAVAENFRYLDSLNHAREQVQRLGRLLNFRVKVYSMVKLEGKYYSTSCNFVKYKPVDQVM